MTEIDLSKYAAGKKLRCICRESAPWLIYGKEYESLGEGHEGQVLVRTEYGAKYGYYFSRFVPVEDEAPESVWRDGIKGERLSAGTVFRDPWGGENVLLVNAICEGMYIRHDESTAQLRYRESSGREGSCLSIACRGIREPALSPGHAIREPARLNEAQREAVGRVDPYALNVAKLESKLRSHNRYQPGMSLDAMCAASMAIEDNARDEWKQAQTGERQLSPRERLIAALRRDLDDGSRMKAFPHPGRNFALEKWR